MSALVVAIQMIDHATKGKTGNKLKYDRRIIVISSGEGNIDIEDLPQIQKRLKEEQIEITLL